MVVQMVRAQPSFHGGSVEDVFAAARFAVRTCGVAACAVSRTTPVLLYCWREPSRAFDRASKFVANVVGYVGEGRIRPLLDALLEDGMLHLLRCPVPSVLMSLASFPFHCLSGQASWKTLMRIYLGCKVEAGEAFCNIQCHSW